LLPDGFAFFADHCVPTSIIQFLTGAGYEVLVLREYLPIASPDTLVIEKAQELEAILISLNGDFSDVITYPPSAYGGIIAIQLRNHPEIIPPLMGRLVGYLTNNPNMEHYRGKLLLAEVHRIRVRQ
jgi:predicted nuclease of predicted toxin-antitoxin system